MGDYYMGGWEVIPQHMTTRYDLTTSTALHFYPPSTRTSVTR